MRSARGDRGHAIVIALIVLVLVGAASAAVALGLQLEMRSSLTEARRIQLVALGDAAMADALAELARSRSYRGTPERRLGGGTYSSRVHTVGANRFEIETSASVRGWERRATALVVVNGTTPRVLRWAPLSAAAASSD